MPRESECLVVVDADVQLGTFANAFRVVDATGEGCFLDFLVYSAYESRATVSMRVRVQSQFLGDIFEAIDQAVDITVQPSPSGLRFQN